MTNKFYVYTLAYPESMGGKVFYVGKGSKSRIKNHLAEARKGVVSAKCDAIRVIWAAGLRVVEAKVAEFSEEAESYQYEKVLIASIGLENLTNSADGQGGRREGTGRPAMFKDPVTLIFKVSGETASRIKARASAESRPYAELLREMAEKL
jgi:hypothetical protein